MQFVSLQRAIRAWIDCQADSSSSVLLDVLVRVLYKHAVHADNMHRLVCTCSMRVQWHVPCVVDREYLGSMVGIGDTKGGGTARGT